MPFTWIKLVCVVLAAAVFASGCASTYNVRAETDACTETRRSCVTECDTAACSADERACLGAVVQENEAAEGAADRQTTGLIDGLQMGLGLLVSVVAGLIIVSAQPALSNYFSQHA